MNFFAGYGFGVKIKHSSILIIIQLSVALHSELIFLFYHKKESRRTKRNKNSCEVWRRNSKKSGVEFKRRRRRKKG